MTVDILCRVVDNLGDIGFAYRLARALSELADPPRLRVVIDDLGAFAALCPGVEPSLSFQAVGGWDIARWDAPGDKAIEAFRTDRPRVAIECYACGRPDWYESILFDEADPEPRQIIDLEYLTAEAWSEEYHLLPSLTRSPRVAKGVFMPGFRPGTGGLLQDRSFMDALRAAGGLDNGATPGTRDGRERFRIEALADVNALQPAGARARQDPVTVGSEPGFDGVARAFWVFVFSYEHEYDSLVADIAAFAADRPVYALVAAGRSADPFLSAWRRAGRPFPALALPLVSQPLWDRLLVASDFLIVRGEESFSRAVLSGRPFLWECYPFTEDDGETAGHLGKVRALLDLLRPLMDPDAFTAYEALTLRFNGVDTGERSNAPSPGGTLEKSPRIEALPGDFLRILRGVADGKAGFADSGHTGAPIGKNAPRAGNLAEGFLKFAQNTRDLGNLAVNLMTFMRVSG